MIVTPNNALIADIRGSLGAIRFQRYYRRYLARRRWELRAPATDPQIAHRLTVARAAALYGSVRALVYPAWIAYAAGQPCGPFASWQALNIPAVRLELPTCITPPNAAYAPITAPDLQPGAAGQVDATWAYTGPPATHYVALYVRAVDAYAWTLFDTVDAQDEAATITGLELSAPYEVALVAHTADELTFGQAYHELLDAGADPRENFDTWTELDPGSHILPADTLVTVTDLTRNQHAHLYYDFGVDHFGLAMLHTFRLDFDACDDNGSADCWAIANSVDCATAWLNANAQAITLELWRGPGGYRLNFKSLELGTEHLFDDYAAPATYYAAIERTSETAIEARIYTDEAMTVLKHTHQVAVPSGRRYRYGFAVNCVCVPNPNKVSFRVRDLVLA